MARTVSRRISSPGRSTLLVLGVAAVGYGLFTYWNQAEADPAGEVPTAAVQRVNLSATVIEFGEVDSSEKTVIEARLESLSTRSEGGRVRTSGSSVILELVPEGTQVEAGQVICRLDASEYEEMVRRKEIELQEHLANYNSSRLTAETLEIQLSEYRDGRFIEQKGLLQSRLAIALSELQRQRDQIAWADRMSAIGYVTESQYTAERNMLLQREFAVRQAQLAYANLITYTAPKTIIELQSRIDGAMARLYADEFRVNIDREQLARYRRQLDYCTIRAPHDGLLLYADKDDDNSRIEFGAPVRRRQELFYLPDLDQMEVRAKLHESVVTQVKPGMPAQIRVEALPEVLLEGEVVHVASLPIARRGDRESDDVKNYEGRIKLHAFPEGLMPGMTAQVEILTAWKPDTLVIPPQALGIESGLNVCYVPLEGGIERREVTLGAYHPQMIEILAGLSEGERVVTDLNRIDRNAAIRVSSISALAAAGFP